MEIPDWRLTAAAQLWESARTALQEQLSEATWNTWFRDVRAVDLDGDHLQLATPNAVVCERIRSNYQGLIGAVVQQCAGDELVIDLTVDSSTRVDEPVIVLDDREQRRSDPGPGRRPGSGGTATVTAPVSAPAAVAVATEPTAGWTALNPRYTFDQFVIGASNRFAHAAALAVAETPGPVVQPAVHLRPGRAGQDPPAARDRPPRARAVPPASGSATSRPRRS